MSRPTLFEPIIVFRLKRSALFLALILTILLLLGRYWAALGVAMGVGLFIGNAFLLYEIGRSLLAAESRRGVRAMAIVSSAGRFLMMGVALGLIGMYLGREALLGACGGLLVSQVNLHLPLGRSSEAV